MVPTWQTASAPPGTLHKCTPVLGKHHNVSCEDFFRCLRMDVRKCGTYKRRQRQACTLQPDHVTTNNACTQQRPLTTLERQKQGELPTVRPGPALHSQPHPSQARRNPLGENNRNHSEKLHKASESCRNAFKNYSGPHPASIITRQAFQIPCGKHGVFLEPRKKYRAKRPPHLDAGRPSKRH